jgi:hypothetical protein
MYGYIYLYEKFVANRQIIVDSIILYKYIYIYIYRRANSVYNDNDAMSSSSRCCCCCCWANNKAINSNYLIINYKLPRRMEAWKLKEEVED